VPGILGPFRCRADPKAGDTEAELVVVHPAQGFAEDFADSVVGVGPDRVLGTDPLPHRIETGGVVRGGEDHPRTALAPCRLKNAPRAAEICVKDVLEGRLGRDRSQMDAGVAARDRAANGGKVCYIPLESLLAGARLQGS
jgi:hypothetical protein